MRKVIQNNLNVCDEIRGVMINGEERRGIEPTGVGCLPDVDRGALRVEQILRGIAEGGLVG